MAKKKLATVRKGIKYQDLIAAEALLDLLGSQCQNPPSWVKLECKESGKFDDVVIAFPGREVRRQVKWAAHPGAEPLTIDEFSKTSSNRKTSLIAGYAKSWKSALESGVEFELEFLTNRSADTEFQKLLSGNNSKIKTSLTKSQETRLESWRIVTDLNKSNFRTFRRSISYKVNQPDIETQTKHVKAKLAALGGNEFDFKNLIAAIEDWTVDEKVDRITAAMVQERLKLAFSLPPNEFQLAAEVTSRAELNREIGRRIESMSSGYIVLLGKPGSGKSTALNTFERDMLTTDFHHYTVIYNCFTGTGDNFLRTRAKQENFVKYLTQQFRSLALTHLLRTPDGNLEQLLKIASDALKEDRKLIVFVDGLDYARSFAQVGQLNLIESLPSTLPKNVIFVLSAQIANQLPLHLQALASEDAIRVPNLNLANICDLIQKHQLFNAKPDSHAIERISRKIENKSSGHALYVGYTLRAIKNKDASGTSIEEAIEALPPFDEEVANYYERLLASSTASSLLRDSIGLMASCPFPMSYSEIAALLTPSERVRTIEDELSNCLYLFETGGGFLQFGHDSLRVFALQKISGRALPLSQQSDFLLKLKEDPRPGEFLLPILVELEDLQELDQLDVDWIIDSIVFGANIWLIHEGLKAVAQFFLAAKDWHRMSRFWCLMACLERAADSFDLNEPTMIRAWLDTGQMGLIERHLFLGSQFHSKIYPSEQAIDLLEEYGEYSLAARLREKSLAEAQPHLSQSIHDFEFEEHIRIVACRKDPGEIIGEINKRVESYRIYSARTPVGIGATSRGKYCRIAAECCLAKGEYLKVEQWLRTDDSELDETYKWDLWLRLGLARGDLASCNKERVEFAISQVTRLENLIEVARQEISLDKVEKRFGEFLPPHLLKPNLESWEIRGSECDTLVFAFYQQVWLAKKLNISYRLAALKSGARFHSLRRSRMFLEFVHDVACFEAGDHSDWLVPIRSLVESLKRMEIGKWNTGFADLDVCTEASKNLGFYLRPLICRARDAREIEALRLAIGEELIPALENRFLFDGTIFGICDQLILAGTCGTLTQELLELLEKRNDESQEFKSGGYLSLARRFKKLGDEASAKRVVRKGIAACFSYAYRKDTTINHFIDTFDAVIPHLGEPEVRSTTEFITQVLLLLDELTDLAMLHDAPTYLVVFLAKHGFEDLAIDVIAKIRATCRSMRSEPIAQVAFEECVSIESLSTELVERMPDIEIGTIDPGISYRSDFDSSTTVYASISEMIDECEAEVADSSYCSAFWKLNDIVRTLLNCGQTVEALAVFREFRRAIQALVSHYPPRV